MEQLAAALSAAFPDRFALDRLLLFKMTEDLDRITKAKTHDERVFYVVKWAWAKHRLDELLAAACSSVPASAELSALAKDVNEAADPDGAVGASTDKLDRSDGAAAPPRSRDGTVWHL